MKALCLHFVKIVAQDAASTVTWCSKKHKTEVDTTTYFILGKRKGEKEKENKEEKKKKRLLGEKSESTHRKKIQMQPKEQKL